MIFDLTNKEVAIATEALRREAVRLHRLGFEQQSDGKAGIARQTYTDAGVAEDLTKMFKRAF